MRIIGGIHKGFVIKAPKDLPVRPTTDFAKEALFNILANKIDFEELTMLDLFSGTGHIAFEFGSRGAKSIVCVDQNFKCIGFVKSMATTLKLDISPVRSDVFDFLKKSTQSFDLIFADPPYDLVNIADIHQTVFDKKLLKEDGMLIIEHGQKTDLSLLTGFKQSRKYGNVNFSFFEYNSSIA